MMDSKAKLSAAAVAIALLGLVVGWAIGVAADHEDTSVAIARLVVSSDTTVKDIGEIRDTLKQLVDFQKQLADVRGDMKACDSRITANAAHIDRVEERCCP